jgi:hypothetical protein
LLTKLKQSAWALVATAALSTAAFGVLPSTAEAQDMPSVEAAQGDNEPLAPHSMVEPASEPATYSTVIVNPGDSLWSIVQEQLNPETTTPQQIALEVDRIYELNQDRIGGDPNLIFPGQEFLVPPTVMAEPAASATQPQTRWGSLASEEPATAAAASPAFWEEEPVTSEPTASEEPARSEGPAALEEPITPQPVASEEPATSEQVTEPVNDPAALSNNAPMNEETASPLAGIVDPLIEFYDNHKGEEPRLLGVGILVLTVLVAILMAWKLPMRRGVDGPTVWGIPGGYYQERPPTAEDVEDNKPAPASGAPEPTRRGPSDPTGTEEAKPASDSSSESLSPSLAAQRRQERLRRIHQRTLRQTRRAENR